MSGKKIFTKKQIDDIKKMPSFEDWQKGYFAKNPKHIKEYADFLINEYNKNDEMDYYELMAILKKLAKMYGASALARETKLSRENIYRAVSPRGNPTAKTLSAIGGALGYKLTFTHR